MNKEELNALSREELISKAESVGVKSPRTLSQPELVDEILLRTVDSPAERQASRGWFGRARDLLNTVIERGLHLPEAAKRITQRPSAPPAEDLRDPYPTVTLAEIYEGQGHQDRAQDVLRQVLLREPGHKGALTMLDRLSASAAPSAAEGPAPAAEDASSASAPEATDTETTETGGLPSRYDVDEVVAIAVDPTTAYVYWEVRPSTMAEAKHRHSDGRLVLRAVTVAPSHAGPISEERDITIDALCGDIYLSELDAGTNVRVSVGWRWGDPSNPDDFEPFAVGLELATPRATPEMLAGPLPSATTKRTPVVRLGGPVNVGATTPGTGAPSPLPHGAPGAAGATPTTSAGSAGSSWTRTVLWRGGAGQTLATTQELEQWVLERAGASDLVRRRVRELRITGASELARIGASDLARIGASDLARLRAP